MRNIITVAILALFSSFFISCESQSSQKNRLKNNKSPSLLLNNIDQKKGNKNSVKILTWNIQELGRSKNIAEIAQIAQIIKEYDIVAIQEVVAKDPKGAQAVAKISAELNRLGNKWDYRISDPTNSPTTKMSERYAFIWKTAKVRLLKRPYLDKHLQNICVREPYIGKFNLNNGNHPFYLINVHSRVHSENPEKEISFFKEYPNRLDAENIIILGDFNLEEDHIVWNEFYEMGFKSSIQNAPTTLKRKCKRGLYLNHSIDNIYYNSLKIELVNSGRIDFINDCENLKIARGISDHLPVFLECEMK